jgi:exopolysaccharide biosynthesis predicted pyruvyltransferase EpsI
MTQQLVADLRAAIDEALGDLVDPRYPVALLDYPDHGNPGDAAIWLGTTEWLSARGHEIVYLSDWMSFSADALRRRIGNGTILLHGGGNFGALYPEHHTFRERVVETFPQHRVVLLPQTLEFAAEDVVSEGASFLARHPNAWAMGRDKRSFELLARHMGERARLCPDMAFAMSVPQPEGPPDYDIVRVARRDREATGTDGFAAQPGELVTDWNTSDWMRRDLRLRYRWAVKATNASKLLTSPLVFDRNARFVFGRGLGVLGRGRVVVSDRLHVHIISVILGRPHVSLDNSYGKLRAFRDTWTSTADNSYWATDPADAGEQARALLTGTP